jgi:hypothetical protein
MMYHNMHRPKDSTPASVADYMLADPATRLRSREDAMIAGLRAAGVPSKKSRKRQERRRQGTR